MKFSCLGIGITIKMKTILLVVLLFLQGCTLNPFLDVAEVGSKSYEVVKNANSLDKVAGGLVTLADTRKIKAETKAETTQTFVEGIGVLIANQPISKQADLIKQSIQAKVNISENTKYKGWLEASTFLMSLLGLIIILKYLLIRFASKIKKKEYV